ncbi:hypothetical protein MASR2M74_01530 [Paracoccaceae bacterium]
MIRFDSVAVVDWSASSALSPARPSPDAIWIGQAGRESRYFRGRAEAEAALRVLIAEEQAAGRRLLIGFDFPFGYPAGFAARLTGEAQAQAVWAWLAARIEDGPDNRNSRFAVAAAINRQMGGTGPFWGCPAGLNLPGLPAVKAVDYAALGLPERRAVERLVPRAQPVWKLYTTGAAGSQALMGLPMIHRLAALPGVVVWPFAAPEGASVVLAEVYPSLLARAVAADAAAVRDEAQVRLLARALSRADLAPLLAVPEVAHEEGWILGAGHVAALEAAL